MCHERDEFNMYKEKEEEVEIDSDVEDSDSSSLSEFVTPKVRLKFVDC